MYFYCTFIINIFTKKKEKKLTITFAVQIENIIYDKSVNRLHFTLLPSQLSSILTINEKNIYFLCASALVYHIGALTLSGKKEKSVLPYTVAHSWSCSVNPKPQWVQMVKADPDTRGHFFSLYMQIHPGSRQQVCISSTTPMKKENEKFWPPINIDI